MNDKQLIYSVYYLFDNGNSASAVAKELGLKVKDVKNILAERVKSVNNNVKTTSSKANSKQLMITETSGKGTKSVAIMTKAASEVNDAFKQTLNSTQSRTSKNAIYRPNK